MVFLLCNLYIILIKLFLNPDDVDTSPPSVSGGTLHVTAKNLGLVHTKPRLTRYEGGSRLMRSRFESSIKSLIWFERVPILSILSDVLHTKTRNRPPC